MDDLAQYDEFHIVANCPVCGVPADAWSTGLPKVKWTADGIHGDTTEQIELECETCGYEFEVTVSAHKDGWEVFLTEDPSRKGTLEHFAYDDWIDEVPVELTPAQFSMKRSESGPFCWQRSRTNGPDQPE
jgi:rubredoxin